MKENELWNYELFHVLYEIKQHACITDTSGSDNSIPMAYLTLDHQLQVKESLLSHSVFSFFLEECRQCIFKADNCVSVIVYSFIYALSSPPDSC